MSEKQQRERAGKFYAPGFSKLSTWSVFGRLEDPFESASLSTSLSNFNLCLRTSR